MKYSTQLHIFTFFVCSLLIFSTDANAKSPFSDGWMPKEANAYSPYYNGTFTGFGARYGTHFIAGDGYSGFGVEAGPRMSFPMLIGDMRLRYRYDSLTNEDAKIPGDISIHSVGVEGSIHPLYLLLLGSDWLSYVASSLSIDLGLGAQLASRTGTFTDTLKTTDAGFYWHWGAGFDVPLWDPDIGHALWLNVVYRNHRSDFDASDDIEIGLSMHSIFLGLEWRFNTLLF